MRRIWFAGLLLALCANGAWAGITRDTIRATDKLYLGPGIVAGSDRIVADSRAKTLTLTSVDTTSSGGKIWQSETVAVTDGISPSYKGIYSNITVPAAVVGSTQYIKALQGMVTSAASSAPAETWGVYGINNVAGGAIAAYGTVGELYVTGTGTVGTGAVNTFVSAGYFHSDVAATKTISGIQDVPLVGIIESSTGRRKAEAAVGAVLAGAINQSTAGAGAAYKVYDFNTGASFDYGLDLYYSSGSYTNSYVSADIRLVNQETIDNATDGTVQITASTVQITAGVVKHAYDAAAYWTATQANAGAVTFNSVSDGTPGFNFSQNITVTKTVAATDGVGASWRGVYSNITVPATITEGTQYYQAVRGMMTSAASSAVAETWAGNFINNIAGGVIAAYGVVGELNVTGTGTVGTGAVNTFLSAGYFHSDVAATKTISGIQEVPLVGIIESSTGRRKAEAAIGAVLAGAISQSTAGAGAAYKVYDFNTGASFDYGLDLYYSSGTYTNTFVIADIRLASAITITSGSGSPDGSITAPQGSLYVDTAGSVDAQLWINEAGGTAWCKADTST